MVEFDPLSNIFVSGKSYTYKPGEIILRMGDQPQGIYYIEKGYVKSYSITEEGDEKLYIIYRSGEIFPCIWLFRNIGKSAYYEALGNVVIKRIPKAEILEFLKKNPLSKESSTLLYELVNRIIDILDIYMERVDNLELTKSYPRLLARLLTLAKRFGRNVGKEIILDVAIGHHKDIANSINMTRETASRELEKLEKKDLVKYKERFMVIKDIKKLKKELELYYERKPL